MKIVSFYFGSAFVLVSQAMELPPRNPGRSKVLVPAGRRLNGDIVLQGFTTAEQLAQTLLGDNSGLAISNVIYTGADGASGGFSNAEDIFGIDNGVVMTTGSIANIQGPNTADDTTTDNGLSGDSDLNGLTVETTRDASVLEFDFQCSGLASVEFEYVFASEEYNEFVDSEFNDVFAFFLNNINIAKLPDGSPVAINSLNCGNPYVGSGPHCELFRNNDMSDGGGAINTEMDGLTTVLQAQGSAIDGINHIKLAIADTGDGALDSAVLIKSGSFKCSIQVPVDIMPLSCPNPLSEQSNEAIPAAILGHNDLNVMDIDPATVSLSWKGRPDKGSVSPIQWNHEDVATPFEPFLGKTGQLDCTTEGGDGVLDLALEFDGADVRNLFQGSFESGTVFIAQIDGYLYDGTAIEGEDVMLAVCELKELLSICDEDSECCSGMCTGRTPDKKKCRACARKKEMCEATSDCCNGADIRYCNNGKCVECPDGGPCPP